MGREGYPKQDKLARVILPASVYLRSNPGRRRKFNTNAVRRKMRITVASGSARIVGRMLCSRVCRATESAAVALGILYELNLPIPGVQ